MLQPFEIAIAKPDWKTLRRACARAPTATRRGRDWDAGMNPTYLRTLVDYWRDAFDWRAQEAALNRFAHFRCRSSTASASTSSTSAGAARARCRCC